MEERWRAGLLQSGWDWVGVTWPSAPREPASIWDAGSVRHECLTQPGQRSASNGKRLASCLNDATCEPFYFCSGGQGIRTLNPLRGAAFRMRLLAIRVPSGCPYVYSPGLFRARCRYHCERTNGPPARSFGSRCIADRPLLSVTSGPIVGCRARSCLRSAELFQVARLERDLVRLVGRSAVAPDLPVRADDRHVIAPRLYL